MINVSGQTYRKGNQISSNGHVFIYQGENLYTNEKVAIQIANEMTEDEQNIYQILINQKKKFITDVKGLELNEEQGNIVIVTELGNGDFHSYMEKNENEFKKFTNLDKNLIFHQVIKHSNQMVSAVDELHELLYFHRNLKTENFIIIENFNKYRPIIKLKNFGLCKNIQNQNRFTQNVGTILFMAPEVISKDQYDQTSDIWSLGCIYFEMMTMQSFLQGTTYQALVNFLRKISQNEINQNIDQLVQMNLEEKNLLKSILQKEPNQRLNLKEILQKLDNLTKRKYSQDQKYQQQEEDIVQLKKEIDNQFQQQILKNQIEIKQQNQEELFHQKSQNFRINQDIQQQLQQQLNILSQNFQFYVSKCQYFENFINVTVKDFQLNDIKQSLNELEQFYQESDSKFKVLFLQVQTIYIKIEMIQKEKWSQYNDLCLKVHQFQQQSKECRFPKDIQFCKQLCQIQKLTELLRKYEEHFEKCKQLFHENEKIGQLFQARLLTYNRNDFNFLTEQNLKQIHQIKESAGSNFQKLSTFLSSIFDVHKEQIKFGKDSSFYESMYKSFQSYYQLIEEVDSLNSQIQDDYSKENQYDNNFYNARVKAINNYINQLQNTKQTLSLFEEVELQKDRNCFIRLVFFLIVIQFFILNDIMQRQLIHLQKLKHKQSELQKNQVYNQNQKYEEFQTKMVQYQKDLIKFQQFLSLDQLQYNDEYLKLIDYNDDEIEKQYNIILINDQVKLRGSLKDQDNVKKALEYCRTVDFCRTIQVQFLTNIK